MMGDSFAEAVIGVLLALWLVGATLAIWHGLSLRRQALKTLRQTSRLARLLETAPAIPLIIRGDGRIEASERFSRLLGMDQPAGYLKDLAPIDGVGLAPDALATLEGNIRETQRTGKPFTQAVSVSGSDIRLMVAGRIADASIYPSGAALLWVFDSSNNLRELETVRDEAENAKAAFAALSGLIEASPIPIWHRGPDLRLNFVNTAYVSAVNGTDGETVVADSIELIEPLNGATAMSFAAKAQQGGQTTERIVSSTINGDRRQMRVFDIPLGKSGVAGLAIDVQDLIDTRAEYRRFSDSQRDLLNMMSAGVAQFDADQILSFANLPFQRLFAFRDQWLADRPEFVRVLDRMRENNKLPEVRDFPAWRLEHESWFRMAEPVEENWLLPDGTHLRVLAQPMPDGGLLLVFEDRTEQVQLASARDTLLRVRTATFDNLFEAIAVFSADGRVSIWNRLFAEIWGVEEDQLAQHPRLDELLPILAGYLKKPAHVSVVAEILRMTTANREARRSRIAFADGRVFQISTVPLPDGNALFAMLDMTDSVQIEQALRDRNDALLEADAIKGRFLSNMSYEFRTPLTSISGFADLLRQGIAGPLNEQATEYVEAIATSSERLSQQINTVLDFSQGEAGALPIARKPVKLADLVDVVLAAQKGQADTNGAVLESSIVSDLGEVFADEKRLAQAFGHVIDNAVRYGGKGVRVLVVARGSKNFAEIIVSDNGPGMSNKEQAAVFDGFGRSQERGAAVSAQGLGGQGLGGQGLSGQGLGLPLAKQLIEAHSGTLILESQPGEGTTVIMRLPRK